MAVIIGVDKLHYAKVTTDTDSETTYEASVSVPNVTEVGLEFNGINQIFRADNGAAYVYTGVGEVDLTINLGDLPPDDYAALIGATKVDGKISYKDGAEAPDVAVGFRTLKADGSYRYMWIYKGKFTIPNVDATTKEADVEFQPQVIEFKGYARKSDKHVFQRIDDDDSTLPEGDLSTLPTAFFDDPDFTPTA